MGVLVIVGGAHVDKYHNLMQSGVGRSGFRRELSGSDRRAKRFCIATGAFYLTLATLGLMIGNPAMSRASYFGPMLLHTETISFTWCWTRCSLRWALLRVGSSRIGRATRSQRWTIFPPIPKGDPWPWGLVYRASRPPREAFFLDINDLLLNIQPGATDPTGCPVSRGRSTDRSRKDSRRNCSCTRGRRCGWC